MKKKKKENTVDQDPRLVNLTNKVLQFSKHIPLYNSFIDKKKQIKYEEYGIANHIETNITEVKCKYPFYDNTSKETEYIKCKKLIIFIDDSYKKILLGYFTDYINMYNSVIFYFNKNKNEAGDFRKTRKLFLSEKKKYSAPSHVLDGAIKSACTSLKSALTNKQNKNIKYFTLKPIKHSKKSKIIDIEQCYFNDEYIFKRFLKKKIKNAENYNYSNIQCDSKLHYDVKKDRFTLLIPVKSKIIQFAKENQISIDMGQRTLITGLADDKIIEMGTNISEKIGKQLDRIDRYNKIIGNNKNITEKKGFEKLTTRRQSTTQKLKNKIKIIRLRIKNQVIDFHWKIINYLTTTYKNITVGKWSTKDCSKNGKSKLSKRNKRIQNALSIYKFRERLEYKSLSRGNNLQILDEAYTTQICSYCGIRDKDIGSSKIYNCQKCKRITDRDVNSCRNIQMLGLN